MSDDTRRAVATRNPFAVDAAPVQSGRGLISAEQQRAIAEVQARYLIARGNPRNAVQAVDLILQDCMRPTLAEAGLYAYSRGGTDITGPTIRLAEAIARRWGNIAAGIKEVARHGEYSECIAYAHDLETGYYDERQYQVRHWRDTKKGGYRIVDERDIYELIANFGQRRKRAVLLSVIPGDVVDAAIEQCEATLRAKADTSPEALAKMAETFRSIGVSKEQIEARCQRRIEALHPAQVIQLRKIFLSIRDGMSEARDWFNTIDIEAELPRGNAGLRDSLRGRSPAEAVLPDIQELKAAVADITRPAEPPADDGATPPDVIAAGVTADDYADLPAPQPPIARVDDFWSGATLAVQPIMLPSGKRADWQKTHALLLRRIGEAMPDDLGRLQNDSHRTLNGLKLAYIGLYDEVIDAFAARRAELEGGP